MINEFDNISVLKKLLACGNLPQNPSEYFDYFDEIAKILMNKCVISKGEINYEIVEIEFYLFTHNHQDVITYPRKIKPGQWFFHQSGVDLTFMSDENQFGGILIRGLRKISADKRQIFGPQKCVEELWDKFDALKLNTEDYPLITECCEILENKLTEYPRHISTYGKNPNVKIEDWTARIPSIFKVNTSKEERAKLVFDSKYRFFKMDSIDQYDAIWRNYGGKPKTNQIVLSPSDYDLL